MSSLTLIPSCSWCDVFPDGYAVFDPIENAIRVHDDLPVDQVRQIGDDFLYLCADIDGKGGVWCVGQRGTDGMCLLSCPSFKLIELGMTFGQQVCAIVYDSRAELIRVAATVGLTTWTAWAIDPGTETVVSTQTNQITIQGQIGGTTQGILDWPYPRDPRWTDYYRSTTIDGVTMLLAVSAHSGLDSLVVGQPVVGPPQVSGVFVEVDGATFPTSLFLGHNPLRWPKCCVNRDGTYSVITALDKPKLQQAALWRGQQSELPGYVGTTPVTIPDIPPFNHRVTIAPFCQAQPLTDTSGGILIRIVGEWTQTWVAGNPSVTGNAWPSDKVLAGMFTENADITADRVVAGAHKTRIGWLHDGGVLTTLPKGLRPWCDVVFVECYRIVGESLSASIARWWMNLTWLLGVWTGQIVIVGMGYRQEYVVNGVVFYRWTEQDILDCQPEYVHLANVDPRVMTVSHFCANRGDAIDSLPEVLRRFMAASPGPATLNPVTKPTAFTTNDLLLFGGVN
jgi:hypothetical protein